MFYLTWIIAQPPEIYYLQKAQEQHGSSMGSRGTKPTKSKTGEISQPVIGHSIEKERRSGWVGKKKESCNIRMPYVLEPKCTST